MVHVLMSMSMTGSLFTDFCARGKLTRCPPVLVQVVDESQGKQEVYKACHSHLRLGHVVMPVPQEGAEDVNLANGSKEQHGRVFERKPACHGITEPEEDAAGTTELYKHILLGGGGLVEPHKRDDMVWCDY